MSTAFDLLVKSLRVKYYDENKFKSGGQEYPPHIKQASRFAARLGKARSKLTHPAPLLVGLRSPVLYSMTLFAVS